MLRHLWPVALLLPACVPDIPEGVLACTPNVADNGCPSGWACHSNARCYRFDESMGQAGAADGGPRTDGRVGDAQELGPDATDGQVDAEMDTGPADAAEDEGGADAAPDAPPPPPPTCAMPSSGITCDDQMFCNGVEHCDPGAPMADARGCVAGTTVTCPSGQICSEMRDMCSSCSDSGNDADKDNHQSNSCGGDDCDDTDPERYPTHAEVCDGKDNDCDGTLDGPAADATCMQTAPTGGRSTCVGGRCEVKCNDPDFDLVDGACVHHDDCANNPCAPGTCTDGSRSFSCTCPSGYIGTTACTDIDECDAGASCNNRATCLNTPGGFNCMCPLGWVGNGIGSRGCVRDRD